MIESRLLPAIQDDLFTEEGLAVFEQEASRMWSELKRTKATTNTEAQIRLKEVDQEIANIMTAIKAGLLTPSTKGELEKTEADGRTYSGRSAKRKHQLQLRPAYQKI